jgi:hypothetical protein
MFTLVSGFRVRPCGPSRNDEGLLAHPRHILLGLAAHDGVALACGLLELLAVGDLDAAAAAMPFLRPRSSTASLVIEAVTTVPLMSRRMWAVVWPLMTSMIVPRRMFLALSFKGSFHDRHRAVQPHVASETAFRHRRIAPVWSPWHRFQGGD